MTARWAVRAADDQAPSRRATESPQARQIPQTIGLRFFNFFFDGKIFAFLGGEKSSKRAAEADASDSECARESISACDSPTVLRFASNAEPRRRVGARSSARFAVRTRAFRFSREKSGGKELLGWKFAQTSSHAGRSTPSFDASLREGGGPRQRWKESATA